MPRPATVSITVAILNGAKMRSLSEGKPARSFRIAIRRSRHSGMAIVPVSRSVCPLKTQRCPLMRLRARLADPKPVIKPAKSGSGNVRSQDGMTREGNIMSTRAIRIRRRARFFASPRSRRPCLSLPAIALAQNADTDDQAEEDGAAPEQDIVVTGTSIRGVPPTGSGLISVSREDARLDRRGHHARTARNRAAAQQLQHRPARRQWRARLLCAGPSRPARPPPPCR